MGPVVITRKKIVEAVPDGLGGPRWVATLEDGTIVVGRPSWMGNSGPRVALPNDEPEPMTDWRRLKDRCEEENKRIRRFTLYIPGLGPGIFQAPEGKGAYGYFEQWVATQKGRRMGCSALCMCWPDQDERGEFIKIVKIGVDGAYEHWRRSKWLPCMIGKPDAEPAIRDHGMRAN